MKYPVVPLWSNKGINDVLMTDDKEVIAILLDDGEVVVLDIIDDMLRRMAPRNMRDLKKYALDRELISLGGKDVPQ